MHRKLILLINLLLILSLFYGCSTADGEVFPTTIPLEQSLKEIIISKGSSYDFLNDELFMYKVNEFAQSLIKDTMESNKHYTIGNLDDDNIPELIVFIERNPNDVNDQGGLGVYKFNGEKYELLDTVQMNYDNSNHLLEVGRISPTQKGILLSNQVGAHSTITYGYIIENGKLKSILNEKKISLVSVYPDNEIKDIDNDGILEFSIYTNDPESVEQSPDSSDKLMLWYKWDENDSANIVKITNESQEKNNAQSKEKKDMDISLMEIGAMPPLDLIQSNMEQYDKNELSQTLDLYINKLSKNLLQISDEINGLFIKYQQGKGINFLIDKYDLSIERLNDLEYLRRERILQSEIELKDHLIKHLEMGYKLDSSEGKYYYVVDYQSFVNNFKESITNQFRDYLKIKATNVNEPYLRDNSFILTREKLSERIIALEHYKLTYPYSKHIGEVNELYKDYVKVFLFGTGNTPNYDANAKTFSEGALAVFKSTVDKYPDSYLSEVIQDLLSKLTLNMNIINDSVINKIYEKLN